MRPPTPKFVPAMPVSAPPVVAVSAPTPAPLPVRPEVPPVRAVPETPAPSPRQAASSEGVPQFVGPGAVPQAAAAVSPPAARRPINPFLSNDPNQKARRLARVLVSDMVTYHPQKREEGLRHGTLKQQFRDEIRKSYEEYVEQVGREFAEATAHFQDALNEILAGGQRLF